MATGASLDELKVAFRELECLRLKNEEIYADFADFFKRNRSVGYKNLCKMLMGEAEPEDLKKGR